MREVADEDWIPLIAAGQVHSRKEAISHITVISALASQREVLREKRTNKRQMDVLL